MKVHFICTGNIMRSVIAECAFRKMAEETLGEKASTLDAGSSGLEAEEGSPPHPDCLWAMETIGIRDRDTIARRTGEEHINRADLVISMTRRQCYIISNKYLEHKDKCFSLLEINGALETVAGDLAREQDTLVPRSINTVTYRESRSAAPARRATETYSCSTSRERNAAGVDTAGLECQRIYGMRHLELLSDATLLSTGELEDSLDLTAATLEHAPRRLMMPLAGVPMTIRDLLTFFPSCFHQISDIQDPLGGSREEIENCARQIDRETKEFLKGLLVLAALMATP